MEAQSSEIGGGDLHLNIDAMIKTRGDQNQRSEYSSLNNTSTLSTKYQLGGLHPIYIPEARFEAFQPSFDDDSNFESSFSIFNDAPQNHQESIKVKKRQGNKDAAARSRMRKKAYFEQVESEYQQSQKEVNRLKLDNAALRAENQLLKRYLSYFENLFAKKSGVNMSKSPEPIDAHKDDVDLEAPSVPIS